jgi:hypothetical protein
MRNILIVTSLVLVVLLSGFPFFPSPGIHSAAASEGTLTRTQSGLVFEDQLNVAQTQAQLESQTNGNWSFGGHYASAHISYVNQNWGYIVNGSTKSVNIGFFENTEGMSVGVKAVTSGPYTGFYAISAPSNAELFHARITSAYKSISGGFLQIGLYVRASAGNTNYVTCASVSSSAGTQWEVIHGTGNQVEATNFDYLWIDKAPNQPSTADCTIVTNGNNYLAVYLNGNLVYQSSSLSLGIQQPVEAYLGVESSDSSETYWGVWNNFYSTLSDSVEVINLPGSSASVSIVNQTGATVGSSSVVNGSATINVAQYDLPILASIRVHDASGNEIASTPNPVQLMGGDIYTGKATIQEQVGSVVGIVSNPEFLYILLPTVIVVLALSLTLAYARRRKNSTEQQQVRQP